MSRSNMTRTLAEIVGAMNLLMLVFPLSVFLDDVLKTWSLSLVNLKMTPDTVFKLYVNSTLTFACSGVDCIAYLKETNRLYWMVTAFLGIWTVPQFLSGIHLMITIYSATATNNLKSYDNITTWKRIQRLYMLGECLFILFTVRVLTVRNLNQVDFHVAFGLVVFIALIEIVRGASYVIIKLFQMQLLDNSNVSVTHIV